jgi:uncharacterized membrane protein
MADIGKSGASAGIAFLISAYGVYEIIAAACSSPQTCEINASTRAGTLMKWVHIGLVQAAILTIIAAWIDEQRRTPILAGAGAAAAMMYGSYVYAKASGLKSPGPGTEGAAPIAARSRWGWAGQ